MATPFIINGKSEKKNKHLSELVEKMFGSWFET